MTDGNDTNGQRPRVLVVCVGNICRSPLAALLLAHRLPSNRVAIHSAGSQALVGEPMPEEAKDIARTWGLHSPELHLAQQLTADHAVGSALILTATRALRRTVVEIAPAATRRTFTLREFARIVQHHNPHDPARLALPEFVHTAAARRGMLTADADADDVVDPYRRTPDVYTTAAGQIASACDTITPALLTALDHA